MLWYPWFERNFLKRDSKPMVDQHGGFSPSSFHDRVLANPKQKNNL